MRLGVGLQQAPLTPPTTWATSHSRWQRWRKKDASLSSSLLSVLSQRLRAREKFGISCCLAPQPTQGDFWFAPQPLPAFTDSFAMAATSLELLAIFSAQAMAASSSFSTGKTLLTRPRVHSGKWWDGEHLPTEPSWYGGWSAPLPASFASTAEIRSPVRTISIARDFPTALVNLCVPPAPGAI